MRNCSFSAIFSVIIMFSKRRLLRRNASICGTGLTGGGIVVERPLQELEVAGSFPGRVLPKTLKIVVMTALLCDQGCGVTITTDWLVSGYLDQ